VQLANLCLGKGHTLLFRNGSGVPVVNYWNVLIGSVIRKPLKLWAVSGPTCRLGVWSSSHICIPSPLATKYPSRPDLSHWPKFVLHWICVLVLHFDQCQMLGWAGGIDIYVIMGAHRIEAMMLAEWRRSVHYKGRQKVHSARLPSLRAWQLLCKGCGAFSRETLCASIDQLDLIAHRSCGYARPCGWPGGERRQ